MAGSSSPCKVRAELGKRRCRFHGGKSTGPKTDEGRTRIAEAQRRRWRAYREGRKASESTPEAPENNASIRFIPGVTQ
ncbi:MAG: HGGxSTG domain-containing protein [Xanthobacteraceae bacterium]